MIQSAVHSFESSKSWEGFVASQRRSAADISCRVRELQHPARNFLDRLRKHGVPVVMSTGSWSLDRKDAAVQRGPHQSAKLELEFVREEFLDFMLKGFWTILPYRLVRHIKSLRLSPLGVVPQRDRRPRLIVDLSFYGINGECVPIAPSEAMQFGRALQRILQRVLLADPIYGPVYVSKIDISDGFYRIHLAPRDTLKLGVLLPRAAGEEPMVAIPLVLPMGWIHSPPYFSAVTETAADVMNRRLKSNQDLPKHRLEDLALHPPPPDDAPTNSCTSPSPDSAPAVPTSAAPQHIIHAPEYRRPMKFVDIYVDDFLGLVQGDQFERRRAMRTILHVLDEVLRPLDPSDGPQRQEPASVKKLKKGDAVWSTTKVVLGWLLNTVDKTIQLPPHRFERLHTILNSIPRHQKRTTAKVWHKLLGELRSMSIAIPGARGLFSTLQTAFGTADDPKSHDGNRRLKLTKPVHTFLDDFRTLAHDLSSRPTRIAELIAQQPSVLGTTDASGHGMGGAAFVMTHDGIEPVVWHEPVPPHIRKRLISYKNPKGTVTNSDLELAATVLQHDVLTSSFDLREHTISTSHDNTPTQHWQRKGSTTTLGPAASLLRLQGHHQRQHRYVPLHHFLSGDLNVMGDDASQQTLAAAPGAASLAFRRDLGISQEAVRRGVVKGTQARADGHWEKWLEFCDEIGVDPLLQQYSDPIPFFQVFATRYRRRINPATGLPVRSSTVADAIRSVGQTMASMGTGDKRKTLSGDLDFRLSRQFKSYTREDPPPHRVKPIPINLIREIAEAYRNSPERDQACVDMIILAFFFLLRPGEYTGTENDDTPFRLMDVQLFLNDHFLDPLTAPIADLLQATSVSLTFTTQKNGVRGEVVNHGTSGHDLLCPVRATIRRIIHLRTHNVHQQTILATYYRNGRSYKVMPKQITELLRAAATVHGPTYGYRPDDISARSLRAGGAMALFNGNVDSDTIKLIGRWQSDAMLRYLHLQAQPVMSGFARKMLQGGDYRFHPNFQQLLVPMH